MNRTAAAAAAVAALALTAWATLPIAAAPGPASTEANSLQTPASLHALLVAAAIDDLTQTLKRHPHLADAYLKRAQFYNLAQQSDLALADYRAFFQNCKHPTAEQTRTVHDGVRTAYLDKAIADLKACIATGKAPRDAYLLLANASLQKQNYPDAITAYSRLIEMPHPDSRELEEDYLSRGLCYLSQAEVTNDTASALTLIDQAIADFDQAAALSPTDSLPQIDKDTALDLKATKEKTG